MTKPLDPRFAKVVARMRGTTFGPERDNARDKAERIAQRCGMTFEEALQIIDAAAAAPQQSDAAQKAQQAAQEKARQDAERAAHHAARWAARTVAWQGRRAATIARFGSEEAALAPCRRERLILDALAPWRLVNPAHPRWTDRLDGWRDDPWCYSKAPDHIRLVVANAYPLPTTFAEAKAENDYWTVRSDEMEDLIRDRAEDLGMGGLDLAADLRACMVRDLVEKDLRVTTLEDLHARFAAYRSAESHNWEIEGALFRDLSAIIARQAEASKPTPAAAPPPPPIRPGLAGQIEVALTVDPSRSDRAIARVLGCSPTTVGQMRGQMGLADVRRSVQRGGQVYGMRARAGR